MESINRKQKDFILFLEDDLALSEIVSETLQAKGHNIVLVNNIALAQQVYDKGKPALLIVDVMLPDGDGFSFVKKLRKHDTQTPVIFLTSKSRTQDVVTGFETGGSDYLKKPFSIAELDARIKAQLKKNFYTKPLENKEFGLGLYVFQYPMGVLQFNNKESIQLTSREAEILYLLVLHRNVFINREDILTKVWGDSNYFAGRSLDVFISKLRKYLKQDPSVAIKNVRGFGYKFIV